MTDFQRALISILTVAFAPSFALAASAKTSQKASQSFEARSFRRVVIAPPEDPRLTFDTQDAPFLVNFQVGDEAMVLKRLPLEGRVWVQVAALDARGRIQTVTHERGGGAPSLKVGWMTIADLDMASTPNGMRQVKDASLRRLIDECAPARERYARAAKRARRAAPSTPDFREASYLTTRTRARLEQLGCGTPPPLEPKSSKALNAPRYPRKGRAS